MFFSDFVSVFINFIQITFCYLFEGRPLLKAFFQLCQVLCKYKRENILFKITTSVKAGEIFASLASILSKWLGVPYFRVEKGKYTDRFICIQHGLKNNPLCDLIFPPLKVMIQVLLNFWVTKQGHSTLNKYVLPFSRFKLEI